VDGAVAIFNRYLEMQCLPVVHLGIVGPPTISISDRISQSRAATPGPDAPFGFSLVAGLVRAAEQPWAATWLDLSERLFALCWSRAPIFPIAVGEFLETLFCPKLAGSEPDAVGNDSLELILEHVYRIGAIAVALEFRKHLDRVDDDPVAEESATDVADANFRQVDVDAVESQGVIAGYGKFQLRLHV
jgi:hypothetical protein